MFDKMVFDYRLRKLIRIQNRFHSRISKFAMKAKKADPNFSLPQLMSAKSQEFYILEDAKNKLISSYWIGVADRETIPLPSPNNKEHWEKTNLGEVILSSNGISELRTVYYAYKRDKQSVLLPWITLTFSALAAVGTLGNILWTIFWKS